MENNAPEVSDPIALDEAQLDRVAGGAGVGMDPIGIPADRGGTVDHNGRG